MHDRLLCRGCVSLATHEFPQGHNVRSNGGPLLQYHQQISPAQAEQFAHVYGNDASQPELPRYARELAKVLPLLQLPHNFVILHRDLDRCDAVNLNFHLASVPRITGARGHRVLPMPRNVNQVRGFVPVQIGFVPVQIAQLIVRGQHRLLRTHLIAKVPVVSVRFLYPTMLHRVQHSDLV